MDQPGIQGIFDQRVPAVEGCRIDIINKIDGVRYVDASPRAVAKERLDEDDATRIAAGGPSDWRAGALTVLTEKFTIRTIP